MFLSWLVIQSLNVVISATPVLDPQGLWPFNAQYELSDLTGHKNHGVSSNAVFQDGVINGIVQGYMSFNGVDGACVEVPVSMDMYVPEFTLLLYIERKGDGGDAPILWFDSYPNSGYLALIGSAGNRLRFQVGVCFNFLQEGLRVRQLPISQRKWTLYLKISSLTL